MPDYKHTRNAVFATILSALSVILIHNTRPLSAVKAASTIDDTPVTRKVYVVNFNPKLTNHGGVDLVTYKNWMEPHAASQTIANSFPTITHGYINYSIEGIQDVDAFPVKQDGFQYTESSYLACDSNSSLCHQPDLVDYQKIITDYDICNKNVDELWIWGGPYFGYYEHIPNTGFNTNYCNRTIYIMGFNYERATAEMLHDYGHLMEYILERRVGDGPFTWAQDEANEWNKFSLINGHCGNVHNPPWAPEGYNYSKTTPVSTDCDGYLNYPVGPFVQREITCAEWGCSQEGFMRWWLGHIPAQSGSSVIGGKELYHNWWKYFAYFDDTYQPPASPTPTPLPVSGTFSQMSAIFYNPGSATFYFSYSGTTPYYAIDLSTDPAMATDVYLSFAYGSTNPLVVTNPTKWDKYSCGRTLYWRIKAADNTTSDVQATIVDCNPPTPTLTPSPTRIPTATTTPTPTPAATSTPTPVISQFSNLSAKLYLPGSATFNFTFAGTSANYTVDLSTYPDMSWDVYQSFAYGTTSPLVQTNPTQWDKYACGATLYWQVKAATGAVSPIQTSVVDCNPPITPTATPKLTPTKSPTPTHTPTPTKKPTPTRTPTPTKKPTSLLNGGFELAQNGNPANWTDSSKFSQTTTVVRTGNYAAVLRSKSNANVTISQTQPVVFPYSYTLSGWVNILPTSDPFTFSVRTQWLSASGSILNEDVQRFTTSTVGWQQITSGPHTPFAGVNRIRIVFDADSLLGPIYLDDFSLIAQ